MRMIIDEYDFPWLTQYELHTDNPQQSSPIQIEPMVLSSTPKEMLNSENNNIEIILSSCDLGDTFMRRQFMCKVYFILSVRAIQYNIKIVIFVINLRVFI